MTFPQTGFAHESNVFPSPHEVAGGQFTEQCRIDRLLVKRPIEGLERSRIPEVGTLQAALDAAYDGLDQIMFENAEYRTDIGASSLKEAELSLSF